MATSDVTAAIRFLNDAGHLLAITAPETSAYLMSHRNGLMFEHEIPLSDKQREHVCTCCGHIMLPGQGSDLQIRQVKRAYKKLGQTRHPKKDEARSGPTKVMTCGRCSRLTEVKLPAPAPISRRHLEVQKPQKSSEPAVTQSMPTVNSDTVPQKSSTNANSKKRAKSRKAGLQALLDQSTAARNMRPGLGLSLADFMEKK
ncbi:hypothetical protein N656DRAFT_795439 [Canariomyces notabilis]|uniref:Uncharacterized protein n=1 Tax=Canariomyces notabilis TaxID=2074819 RepID=A0AAN6YWR0_9PEZI|nr:hypothetical protein N656DRAFT_795439 [Canariomyces arenarius]